MSESIQIKLKHIAITAEELLAELRGREAVPPAPIIANLLATAEGVVGLEAGQRYIKLIESQLSESVSEADRLRAELAEVTKERDYNAGLWVDIKLERDALQARITEMDKHGDRELLIAEWNKAAAERDALQARIDAGAVVYERNDSPTWGSYRSDSKRTARLIDPQPIADHIVDANKMVDERKGDRRKVEYIGHVQEGHRMYHRKDFGYTRASRTLHGKNDRRRTPGTRADRKESK